MNIPSILGRGALLLAVLGPVLTGCESEIDKYYEEVGGQFPTFLNNGLGTAAKYATGEVAQFELQFAQQTSPIKEIRILQKVEPARDSTLALTIPYRAAFSRLKNADTLVVNYPVPAGANKANVRVDAVVVSENGQTKTRSFNFRLAEPGPTISVTGPTNVTAPASTTPVPGDVVRYAVTINAGGITTASAITATGTLYKDVDSLIVYSRVGTAAERRVTGASRRLPGAGSVAQSGAASTVNVDLTLPAGSSGQPIVYRFEAKSRYQGTALPAPYTYRTATATGTTVTPGTPTSLAAARTVTLTYTGTTGGDLASYNLTTFASVPAAGSPNDKDVSISSTASNAVQLKALNTTKFVRLTSGAAAAYSGATLNSIRQLYQTAAAANQVAQLDNVVVGDVIIARVRNLDQYAIFTVTGINRTASSVVVTMDVKAL